MTDSEFFQQIQSDWFYEFKETELSKNLQSINTHREIFEFDDIPF